MLVKKNIIKQLEKKIATESKARVVRVEVLEYFEAPRSCMGKRWNHYLSHGWKLKKGHKGCSPTRHAYIADSLCYFYTRVSHGTCVSTCPVTLTTTCYPRSKDPSGGPKA